MKERKRVCIVAIAALAAGISGLAVSAEYEAPRGIFTDTRSTGFCIGVNTGAAEVHPVVSPDDNELYFNRGDRDMWVATRGNTGAPFGNATDLQGLANLGIVLNSGAGEWPGCMSPDLCEFYFSSRRDGSTDLFVAKRDDPGQPFYSVEKLGPKVNTPGMDEGGASGITSDGLTLFYHKTVNSQRDAWAVKRPNTDALFGDEDGPEWEPVELWFNSPVYDEYRPTISADGLFLFFSDYSLVGRPDGLGLIDIWVARRCNPDDLADFGKPVNLQVLWPGSAVNSEHSDGHVSISPDWPAYGSKIYFSSSRPPGGAEGDIWEATWAPIPLLPELPRGIFTGERSTGFCIGVNTGETELCPAVSPDGKELYFNRGNRDMWVATRGNTGAPFGNATDLQGLAEFGIVLNSGAGDWPGCMSPDLCELYFSSRRDGSQDLFVAKRAGPGQPFYSVEKLGPTVNTPGMDEAGAGGITSDGLTLFFHKVVNKQTDAWAVQRESTDDLFGDVNGPDPEPLWFNSPVYDEYRPTISADGKFLFFSDLEAPKRPGGLGWFDIWVSSRNDPKDLADFSEPVNLHLQWFGSTVNSARSEGHVSVSADWPAYGSKLYFASSRPPGMEGDIWEATWTASPPLSPRNLRAAVEDGKVQLAWEAAVGGEPAVGYNVYRTPADANPLNGADPVPGTTYTDSGPFEIGQQYCYQVRAVSQHELENGTSHCSSSVCVTPVPLVPFSRGDANADAKVDIADAVCVLGYLFGAPADACKQKVAACFDAADANDDGAIDIADAIKTLGHLFAQTGPLPEPFAACGIDPTIDGLRCVEYPGCQQ